MSEASLQKDSKFIGSPPPGSEKWPKKRKGIHNTSGGNQSTREDLTNFLVKESMSNSNDLNDSLPGNVSREDKNLDNSNLEDEKVISANKNGSTDSNQESDSNESDEYDVEQSEAQYGYTQEQEHIKTSIDSGDTTDKSISTSVINKLELKNDRHNLHDNRDWLVIGVIAVIFVAICGGYLVNNNMSCSSESKKVPDIENIKNKFPTQDDDLWTAFESGIKDVVNFSRPSTFILLYKPEAENTLEDLLPQLTQYAACMITKCSQQPVTVTDAELNSPEMIEDYGRIIDKYRNLLEDKGVMIIKNLENVKGIPAQAFHSFCDEYSPLVEKSVLIFTMKINKLNNQNKVDFVDQYFRNKWTDIKVDTFNALITRMSSMVMEVKP